ncbi:PREDICTED: uncharacterized protein LOC108755045 [Trachymyrmex septentrionalis]|uniref:uncharacterized protein LOC108755045 n=1 Tax=Trachymyrmex septentrionalis TaxID=34720 RepID=UPI00084EE87D|nr:PREDICTED: uncharacterized protein LOC108755045 [Trachymyrmex septentrionalis]
MNVDVILPNNIGRDLRRGRHRSHDTAIRIYSPFIGVSSINGKVGHSRHGSTGLVVRDDNEHQHRDIMTDSHSECKHLSARIVEVGRGVGERMNVCHPPVVPPRRFLATAWTRDESVLLSSDIIFTVES